MTRLRWIGLLLFFIAKTAFANFIGNPQAPDIPKIISFTKNQHSQKIDYWLNARLDYEKQYCSDMSLQFFSGGQKQRCEFSGYSGNFLMLTASILRHIDLYAKAGAVIPYFNFAITSSGTTEHEKINTKTLPAWAVGGKILVLHLGKACFSVEGSYFQTDRRTVQLFSVVSPVELQANRLHWYQWQASAGLSYKVKMLVPYIGAKFSRTRVTFDPSTQGSSLKMENRRKFGVFLGMTFLTSRYMDVDIEGRLIDEQSFSATMGFRF